MKKLAKIFAVVMVCALAVTALVACAPTPNTNYDEAKANLEKKEGYTVSMSAKEGDTGADAIFASMVSEIEGAKAEDVEAVIMATNAKTGDGVSIIWCKNADLANKLYDSAKEGMDEAKEEAKKALDEAKKELDAMEAGAAKDAAQAVYETMKEQVDNMLNNMIVGKTGNVVYSGTKAGIEATK
ncbi:MAG: hypothetical protein NC132_02800 [Corallococcus sp.]|nr:hypothetical protein [Corallococcus sp.]MCM1359038.1 hypothetical protein [Corallococcus sp.]MCM1395027.1 hypothetical protein [Corallococcus sp.]